MRLGASTDGKKQFGVPNDTGGMEVCYRRDLMRKAGLPEDVANRSAAARPY
jgi:ABC-type glycerol-3-phosphate transport system substrate-binding protein